MIINHNPYAVFESSHTPMGLYARQKWLDQAAHPAWQADFKATTAEVLAGQLPDGSWPHGAVETIRRLFALHLTVRSPTPQTRAALDWLMQRIDLRNDDIRIDTEVHFDDHSL